MLVLLLYFNNNLRQKKKKGEKFQPKKKLGEIKKENYKSSLSKEIRLKHP